MLKSLLLLFSEEEKLEKLLIKLEKIRRGLYLLSAVVFLMIFFISYRYHDRLAPSHCFVIEVLYWFCLIGLTLHLLGLQYANFKLNKLQKKSNNLNKTIKDILNKK